MSAVFFNKGENCIAAGRIFVEDSIHDLFVQKVVSSATGSLRTGTVTWAAGSLGQMESAIIHLGQGTREELYQVFNGFYYFSKKEQPCHSN